MVNKLTTAEEKKDLHKAFNIINISGSGLLYPNELQTAYATIYNQY